MVQIGKEIRAVISFNGGKIISISKSQKEFLKWFFSTGNFELACEKSGVSEFTAKNWLRNNKNFKTFIQERIQYAAKVNGYDILKWQARMIDIFEGKTFAGSNQLRAGEMLARSKNFIGPKEEPPQMVNKTEIKDSNVELVFKFEKEPGSLNPAHSPFLANPSGPDQPVLPILDSDGGQTMGEVGIRDLGPDPGSPSPQ